jgi:hypothetical protein
VGAGGNTQVAAKRGNRHYALGRLKPGQKNRTEEAFDAYLDGLKHHGEVLWYCFEGIKLKLSDNCHLTVDFAVMAADGVLEMVDVKGSPAIFSDDAKVKMKTAARLFPFRYKVAFPIPKKHGGGWRIVDI